MSYPAPSRPRLTPVPPTLLASPTKSSTLTNFKRWLELKNYQPTTVKNYISDQNKYLHFTPSGILFSSPKISRYISHLATKNNAKRYLASLNKFCQFALDQNLTKKNLYKSALKIQRLSGSRPQTPHINQLLDQFKSQLIRQKRSPSTIRNYINDLHQYINFINSLT